MPGRSLNVPDVIVLSLLAELAHAHVFDHAGAQRADGRLAHRSAPGPEAELVAPSSSGQGTSHSLNRTYPLLDASSAGVLAAGYRVSGFVQWHTFSVRGAATVWSAF